MIRVLLRLVLALAMLTSPAMTSSRPAPSKGDPRQVLGLVLEEGAAEGCLLPPASCSPCQACLAVLDDPESGVAVAHRAARPLPSADILVGMPGIPEPIPP